MARGDLTDRADRAQRLLEDPDLSGALATIERELVDAMASLDLSDESAQAAVVSLAHDLQAGRRLRQNLRAVIQASRVQELQQVPQRWPSRQRDPRTR